MPEPDDFDETIEMSDEAYTEMCRLSWLVRERGEALIAERALSERRRQALAEIRELMDAFLDSDEFHVARIIRLRALSEAIYGAVPLHSPECGDSVEHVGDCSVPSLTTETP